MNCQKCFRDFPESEIEESHDVPVYLFNGEKRKDQKNQADKFGRHNLCKECHKIYEWWIFAEVVSNLNPHDKERLVGIINNYSKNYFKSKGKEDDTATA